MGDRSIMSARQSAELDHAFERNGWTPADVEKASGGDILAHLLPLVRAYGEVAVATTQCIIDCDAAPFVPNGWKVESHINGGQFVFDHAKVSLYLSRKQPNGDYMLGNELRKEMLGKPVLNANILDYLLKNTNLIPEEWKGKYVLFWGTIYRDSDGLLCVRCLYFSAGRWHWHYGWLGDGWSGSHPAVVVAPAS